MSSVVDQEVRNALVEAATQALDAGNLREGYKILAGLARSSGEIDQFLFLG